MKKSTISWLLAVVVIAIAGVAVSVYSCEKQTISPDSEVVSEDPMKFITEPGAICGEIQKKMVGHSNDRYVADAYIYNDMKYFYVILAATKGHYLGNAYLHVSDKLGEMPLDLNQNVDVANFEYTITPGKMSTLRKFRIPIEEIRGYNFVSAAVEVSNEQTRPVSKTLSWVEGKFYGAEKPGQAFRYKKGICTTDQAQSDSEVE